MKNDPINAVSGFCLSVVISSYKRLIPGGIVQPASDLLSERTSLHLSWAMSDEIGKIAIDIVSRKSDMRDRRSLSQEIQFGQISGSIDAQQTLLQQHLSSDPSLFVVNQSTPSKEYLLKLQVVDWVLILARDAICKSLQIDPWKNIQLMEERHTLLKSALAMPSLKSSTSGRTRHPGDVAIDFARRSVENIHQKSAELLRIYDGIRRLAPYALRHIISRSLFDHLGVQRTLEMAGGLMVSEAMSIASGYPLIWNSRVEFDGIISSVGPLTVGWHVPLIFGENEGLKLISIKDTRTEGFISFIQCVDAKIEELENETIRHATESLVAICRNEAKKPPRYQETQLENCAVLMRRLYKYNPEKSSPNRMLIAEFNGISSRAFFDLAHKIYLKSKIN